MQRVILRVVVLPSSTSMRRVSAPALAFVPPAPDEPPSVPPAAEPPPPPAPPGARRLPTTCESIIVMKSRYLGRVERTQRHTHTDLVASQRREVTVEARGAATTGTFDSRAGASASASERARRGVRVARSVAASRGRGARARAAAVTVAPRRSICKAIHPDATTQQQRARSRSISFPPR